jgi:hypothetical protein
MTIEEIRAGLSECSTMPAGRATSARLESLAARARERSDRLLEAQVLLELVRAYTFGGERERTPVPFARVLTLLDQYPAEVGSLTFSIHWRLKWMTSGLITNPAVSDETTRRWLTELESRYRQRGYSPRPVHTLRWLRASYTGDDATATAEMEAAIAAPRDEMTDCEACERNDWASWRVGVGDDTGALNHWGPLLAGTLRCRQQPQRALAMALLPLVRTGRTSDACSAFLRGYPLVRWTVSQIDMVGLHIEFCALTGNEPRGLEILADHARWLTDKQMDTTRRLTFIAGVCVLLRRLSARGYGSLPIVQAAAGTDHAGTNCVSDLLPRLEQEIRELSGQYDASNGNSFMSEAIARQLARVPLVASLPLGSPARVSQPHRGAQIPGNSA